MAEGHGHCGTGCSPAWVWVVSDPKVAASVCDEEAAKGKEEFRWFDGSTVARWVTFRSRYMTRVFEWRFTRLAGNH